MAPTVLMNYTGQRQSKKCSKTVLGNMLGKPQKVSKGYTSGFVPDYPHEVETMAESEGFGSSGRVEQELSASEDSCALKRNCINLNVDDYDRFGVPVQILSLSRMSHLERRDLEVRLKCELEQVRVFQRKVSSLRSVSIMFSPATDVHSCGNVPKRPAFVGNFPMSNNKVVAAAGKKKLTPGKNGPRTKGRAVAARHSESVKQSVPQNTNFVVLMKQCEALLKQLMKQKNAWIFNNPVDIVEMKIPDYFNVIKHPMDLGTAKMKLFSNQYSSPMGFAADVRLTFRNAMTYNSPGNAVHSFAATLSKFFDSRWKLIEKKIPVSTDESTPSKLSGIIEPEIPSMPPAKKRKTVPAENKVKQKTEKLVMSDFEKQKLSAELEDLLAELPENIIDFLKERTLNGSQVKEDEIEIDIDTLSDDTLFSLRNLLDDYLLKKQKNQTPCEIEIHNESGFSNPYVQPCQGNEPADEAVDIGGNDPPPISSYTTMEIDKDTVQRISKCSSSSSSGSESGSSSSDSDSEGSSAGEADGPRDLVHASTSKETVASELELKNSDLNDPNDCLNGQAEQNSSSNLASVEPNCHQEGESAPHDRQVSPDKLYRAAILRSRFADIIIKAQENNLEKGERPDPEKLKVEKEELGRRRREEKARLQAEAKALEEAKKKAVAEAAAEAKRKRELQREAARQALQKMEKTVDINENSQFMEDLEMFRTAPDEHLQSSFIEEMSPESSQNGLGSFKFQANSNPLEQLGLYMKNDEEEEEEVEPQSIPDTSNDPEEGEID